MPEPDEMTDKGQRDAETIRAWFDELMGPMPIIAIRIGYRYDSTPSEKRLGEWLMKSYTGAPHAALHVEKHGELGRSMYFDTWVQAMAKADQIAQRLRKAARRAEGRA